MIFLLFTANSEFRIKVKGCYIAISLVPLIIVRCDDYSLSSSNIKDITATINEREGEYVVVPCPDLNPQLSSIPNGEIYFFCRQRYLPNVISSPKFRLKGRNFSIIHVDLSYFNDNPENNSLSYFSNLVCIDISSKDGFKIPSNTDLANVIYSIEDLSLQLVLQGGHLHATSGTFECITPLNRDELVRLTNITSVRWNGHSYFLSYSTVKPTAKATPVGAVCALERIIFYLVTLIVSALATTANLIMPTMIY